MLDISRLFEESAYLTQNPDVAQAVATGVFQSGFQHYINFGKIEGRNPSVWFDTEYYLEENPDVAEAVAAGTLSAIEHFVNFGQSEGRDPIFEFFTDFYLEANPDVASAVATGMMSAYQHFRELGLREGRDPGFGFDRPFYLANNPDVAAVVNAGQLSAFEHYLFFGKAEGRLGTPTLDLNAASDLGLLGVAEINGIVSDRNPQQLYRFTLETPSEFNLELGGLSADADVVLFQDLNEDGEIDVEEIIDLSENEGTTPEVIQRGLAAGTYFVGIERFEGNTNYTLLMSTVPSPFVGVNQFEGETNRSLSLSATPTTGRFNSMFGYGLVDAAAAVARALGEPALAPVPELTSTATRNNTGDLNLINAPAVWNRGFTGEGIIVAVLDDGVDWKHPDLANNIWVNPNEIPNNGIDDDGNGFIDDVRGWDFGDGTNNPSGGPGDSHGTHVAGTVAAGRNGLDILTGERTVEMNGVAYNATIMPIRVLGESKSNDDEDFDPVAVGIYYAVENGARVLQMSLGSNPGDPPSPQTQEALAFARERGVVAVISSGNERDSYGATEPEDPALNARNNLAIAIGAVNPANQLATFSNPAGSSPLDFIVAPGVDVLSTYPNQDYDFEQGTSMAAPHVSGVVALMLQANPNLTPDQVEQILIETAQPQGITLALE